MSVRKGSLIQSKSPFQQNPVNSEVLTLGVIDIGPIFQ